MSASPDHEPYAPKLESKLGGGSSQKLNGDFRCYY